MSKDAPEDTGEQREEVGPGRPPKAHQFAPGNPGRPKGARNKLGEAFLEALSTDFDNHGIAAIEKTRLEKPEAYVKVIASLLPREFKIETVSELTDEQLNARVRQLAAVIDRLEGGVGLLVGGDEAPEGPATAH